MDFFVFGFWIFWIFFDLDLDLVFKIQNQIHNPKFFGFRCLILAKFDDSGLNIEKDIEFFRKILKNLRTREFESGKKNFFPESI